MYGSYFWPRKPGPGGAQLCKAALRNSANSFPEPLQSFACLQKACGTTTLGTCVKQALSGTWNTSGLPLYQWAHKERSVINARRAGRAPLLVLGSRLPEHQCEITWSTGLNEFGKVCFPELSSWIWPITLWFRYLSGKDSSGHFISHRVKD